MHEIEIQIQKVEDEILHIKRWKDLLFYCGANLSAQSIQCPRKEEYNEPSVTLYEDGSVWVSGARGCTRMFKNCPYWLMYSIFIQRYNEVENDNI